MRYSHLIIKFLPAILLGGCAFTAPSGTYENIYRPTDAGRVEIKTLPPARQLIAKGANDYFDDSDTLFRRLFRYIRQKNIAMTVPVEGRMIGSAMTFYIGSKDLEKSLANEEDIFVVDAPQRLVASCGARGSYSRSNITTTLSTLEEWLARHPEYRQVGEPYAVFWDAPYVLWFMKRFELHIPVERQEKEIAN